VINLVGGPFGVEAIGFFGAGFFAIALAIRKFLFYVGEKTDAARCSERIDLVAILDVAHCGATLVRYARGRSG
jgi:hypothetical protein